VRAVLLLVLLMVSWQQAGAQVPGLSASTAGSEPIYYRGECIGTGGQRNDGYDPCPRVQDYKGKTREQIDKLQNRHQLLHWNYKEGSGAKVIEQWPPADRVAGWPAAKNYAVALLYETEEPIRIVCPVPPQCVPTVEYRDRFFPFPVTKLVPTTVYVGCPVDQKCMERPFDCKTCEPTEVIRKVKVTEYIPDPVDHMTVNTRTLAALGVGAGGAGALGGYALTRVLRRRRQDEDEADSGPAAPAASKLNARVHPDRTGEQKVIEFYLRPPGGSR